jgi:FlaA1/EpsC-like NDP-sugar epimerase
MINKLIKSSRTTKRIIMVVADALLLPLAFWSAIALRRYPNLPEIREFWWMFILLPVVTTPIFVGLGLYRAVVRYMEDKVFYTVLIGVVLSTMAISSIAYFTHVSTISKATYILYSLFALLYVFGSRVMIRSYVHRVILNKCDGRERVAIYGAGSAGMQLLSSLQKSREYQVVALFDDKQDLHGSEFLGVTVYSSYDIAEVLQRLCFKQIFLAIPSESRRRQMEIVRQFESARVKIKTIPSISELAQGNVSIDDVREIVIEDLLGRDVVGSNPGLLSKCIRGKVVMVTGAGGSIGSELCRQVLQKDPRRLVLFEVSEYALYQIDQELRELIRSSGKDIHLVPLLGSVTHRRRVLEVMKGFGVQTLYHAAAYKHVPLVELNLIEGVCNNVFGTWQTAMAAREAGVETFILISTDKAVRPTNVMGASKRMSELVLQGLASQKNGTTFCMVRFGNVLGSSGSVVPLFRKQIMHGGPVTVTHPDITRYFMTIPEAALLVIQAGSMAKGGDVFVLDMGEPIKIVDLATRMIRLSGLSVRNAADPDGDVAIEFTGLRPGEKLYEELLIGSNASGTEHPRIMRAMESSLPWDEMEKILVQVDKACHEFDCQSVRALLLATVDGYAPSEKMHDALCGVAEGCPQT